MRRRYLALAALAALLLGLRLSAPPLSAASPGSREVLAADGSLLRLTLAADGQYRLWQPLAGIAPAMVQAMLLKEDRYFRWHPGINPVALGRAALATYIGGDRQGASTLTMQLARRLYGINSRTVPGKLEQMLAALWLEARYSKRALLEAYLNLAPMGGNVEGVEAAARIYFHKGARDLSLNEALSLAVMPQSPARRARFGNDFQAARDRLARLWLDSYPQDPKGQGLLALTALGHDRGALPFAAPHFSRYLLAGSDQAVIHSTLDSRLQALLERRLRSYLAGKADLGIKNAAALLIDSRDQAVKAWVGSADFFDPGIQGQVDGVLARRSPGSTLKPFLYGLALDQGLIHPLSILKDAPTAFGDFEPENFDHRFMGPVSAHDALIRSRNVPAVWLAGQLEDPDLYGLLRQAGIQGLKGRNHYGLALALGGGELSMAELGRLYLMLASHGAHYPLRSRQDQPVSPPSPQLLSPAASFLVLDMLKDNPRADGLPKGNWTVSWKTGTSWGFHDAWSAGVTGPYVLVVWVGNFDATPNPAFVGVQAAGPLFFALSDALQASLPATADRPRLPPQTVKKVKICAASGELPNPWCPRVVDGWFIPGISPVKVSTLHRPVWVDNKTGQAACPPHDLKAQHQEVFAFWPSDLAALFAAAGLPRKAPPPLPASCSGNGLAQAGTSAPSAAPQIRSPLKGVSYRLRQPKDSIPLRADAGPQVKALYWFAGRSFLGKTAPGQTLEWRPQHSGHYPLSVSDDQGQGASRELEVSLQP
ncbi:penicillin-binding protein 1C [Gallaecimonas kandeliae]|uniref:penicillin-binding protein 1C n=1 Tax=Gallaecimonas kandeliae TaxID=3029055 RepID=UPI0026486ECC|nr:penicillin-binding protein 1C [Gallaecimonas kandeliae]WKE65536.1 penicillin-binding protein 1C [Gallaecimonas kandeliae]